MLVETTRCFYDLKEDTYRKAGDTFEVSKARFDELNELVAGFVVEVEKAPAKAAAEKEDEKTSEK